MPQPLLRYEMSPRTGLPVLRVPPGALTAQEREALQTELSRRYARLVERPDGPCRLHTRTRLAPDGLFLLRVRWHHPRLPTLLLTPCPGAAAPARPRPGGERPNGDALEDACAAFLLERATGPNLEEALAAVRRREQGP
jgi:hypothetical protein